MKNFLIAATFLIAFIMTFTGCDGIFPSAPKDPVPADHTLNEIGILHKGSNGSHINFNDCTDCHTDDIRGMTVNINGVYVWTPSCTQCHGRLWERNNGNGDSKK